MPNSCVFTEIIRKSWHDCREPLQEASHLYDFLKNLLLLSFRYPRCDDSFTYGNGTRLTASSTSRLCNDIPD